MSWSQKLYHYCERATNPELWGEPLNAITNLAFIFAAIMAFRLARKQPKGHIDLYHYLLILILFIIGVGSGLFHTYATRWAAMADVLPIVIFIFAFLIFALYRLLDWKIIGTLIGLAIFFAINYGIGQIKCEDGPCLNGTISYAPALIALILLGLALIIKWHPAGPSLILAALVFTLSATFRSIDNDYCIQTIIYGYPVGTHFLWHILNALTLYILVRAAILHTHRKPKKATTSN